MEFLKTEGLTKAFKGLIAVNDLDMEVIQGEILGLVGPNGSGKSTTINVITGFFSPTKGKVIYKGESISGLQPHEIAKRGIIRTFQHTSLFTNLTVEQNIISGMHLGLVNNALSSFFLTNRYRSEETKVTQAVNEILVFTNMQEKSNVVAKSLPGAEQRVLEIAIALAGKPKLLLLDEPAAGMNLQEATRIIELIRAIRQSGTTIMLVEHNMKVVVEVCSRIIVLDYGAKIAEGTPEEIANNQDVISIYLGKRKR
jgi:branched-chain amino acid transport system ATP-binding protein